MNAPDLRLVHAATGAEIASRVEIATGFWARFWGLMGRDALPVGHGVWFPETGIHMLFMRFAIDCLFLGPPAADDSHPVVGVRHHLPRWRGIAWQRGAHGVLELPAGTLATSATQVGDTVRFEAGLRAGA